MTLSEKFQLWSLVAGFAAALKKIRKTWLAYLKVNLMTCILNCFINFFVSYITACRGYILKGSYCRRSEAHKPKTLIFHIFIRERVKMAG